MKNEADLLARARQQVEHIEDKSLREQLIHELADALQVRTTRCWDALDMLRAHRRELTAARRQLDDAYDMLDKAETYAVRLGEMLKGTLLP